MALTVHDLTKLQCFSHIHLTAGKKGLKNKINGVGILDYELMPEYKDGFLETFTPGDFVLCSFLYQYCCNKPEEILPMVKELYDYGAAAIACKTVLFPQLPDEVIEFAEANDFPIFQFGKEIYYENIVYEISDALQKDDRNLLTSENIDRMLQGTLAKNRVYTIAKTLSLSFREYCRIVYITQSGSEFRDNLPRYCRNFYLNRVLGDKAMVVQHRDGMFIIITASRSDEKTFDIILNEILEYMHILPVKGGKNGSTELYCCRSRVHKPFESLDTAFRESYRTYAASLAEEKHFNKYDELGVYKLLFNELNSAESNEFADRYINLLLDKSDYMEAVAALILAGGDIASAAAFFGCHPNTIRYKLSKIRELIGCENETENNFYMNICLAYRICKLRQVENAERILI